MQALVLVSVFRQQTRDRLMEWLEWALPDRVPFLWDRLGYTATPAQMLHATVVGKIRGFQAGVARRQAAARLDRRCAPGFGKGSAGVLAVFQAGVARLQAAVQHARWCLPRADAGLEEGSCAGWGL